MSEASSPALERERRLQDVLAGYIEAVEAGQAPDRADLLARHPDLAASLLEFFANQDGLSALAHPTWPDLQQPAAGVAPSTLPSVSLTRFGDYEILHEIARGGMGVVYKARQVSLNREVALKRILADKATSPNTLRRFRIEAEAAAHLDHPNIVPIYDVGESDGQPYFTMKLVEGGSLSSRLDEFQVPVPGEGPIPGRGVLHLRLARLAELLAAVARAVHHAHQRGILHRDLKPANILLDDAGQPMVTDFGLAKRVGQDINLTGSQAIIGTAAYMPPEQAMPSKDGLTVAADIYALGAILYELLTGRPPIVGNNYFETLVKVLEETPLPPRQRNRNVPRDLEAICLKCLHREPAGRYASALELAEDLDRWRAGDAISLRPASTVERAWRWARRNRLAGALLGAVAALLIVGTIGSMLAAWHIAAARDQERAARAAAEEASAENRRLLVSGYVANGTRALDSGDVFAALVWYGEALNLDRGDPAREDAHRVRLATALRRCPRLVQVWFDNDPTRPAVLSPDGRRVVLLRKEIARVWDVGSGEAVSAEMTHPDTVEQAMFSPDGSRLVTTANHVARVWNAATGKPITPPLEHDRAIRWATFSPDGASLATASIDRTARVWDAATGQLLFGPLAHTHPVLFASFSRDGKRLVTSGGDHDSHKGEIRVWDLTLPKPSSRTLMRNIVISWAHLAADGEHVVGVGGRRIAHLWSLAGTKTDNPGVSPIRFDPHGAVGPDPTHVLKVDGSTAQVCDVATGKPLSPPLVHGGALILAAFSPDGRLVATAARDRTVRVWDAGTGKPLTPSLHHGRPVHRAAFSADGRRLLTTSQDGVMRVWDLASRELVQPLPPDGVPTAVSSNSRLIAAVDRDGTVWVREPVSGTVCAGPFRHMGAVTGTAISPGGTRLAVATADGTAFLWDLATSRPAGPPLQHGQPLRQTAFSGDGRRLVTVAEDHTLRVWDVATGFPVTPLLTHDEPITSASLAEDGRRLVVRGKSGAGAAWNLSPDPRPVDDLLHLTRVLSGQALDGRSGGFEPLETASLRDAWPRLRASYPREFTPSP
jgi:WD40 repeat protein/tRNA A-37 threonylcarbamoyl transferase component Bud32